MPDQDLFAYYPYDPLFAQTQASGLPRIFVFLFGILAFAGLALGAALVIRQSQELLHLLPLFLCAFLALFALSLRKQSRQARRLIARSAAFLQDPATKSFFYCMAEPDPSQEPLAENLEADFKRELHAYLHGQRPAKGPITIWEIAPRGYQGGARGQLRFDIRDHRGKRRTALIPDAFPGIPEDLMGKE